MDKKWVVNASPLISLCKIGQQHILVRLSEQLVIPKGVHQEILASTQLDEAKRWLLNEGSTHVKKVATPAGILTAWDLGKGETEVLQWLVDYPEFEGIVDDRPARTCAKVLGAKVRGTMGVLLFAKRHGALPRVKPVLDDLVKVGFYIAPYLIQTALSLADEWPVRGAAALKNRMSR